MYNIDGTVWISFGLEQVFDILFANLVQSFQTCSLHYIELWVNISRDEKAWRRLVERNIGGSILDDTILSAISS